MRALDSAIGFPRRPTSASSMLGFLMPPEVRRNFMLPPEVVAAGEDLGRLRSRPQVETRRAPKTHRLPAEIQPRLFNGLPGVRPRANRTASESPRRRRR